jgi:hypothetical protein
MAYYLGIFLNYQINYKFIYFPKLSYLFLFFYVSVTPFPEGLTVIATDDAVKTKSQ